MGVRERPQHQAAEEEAAPRVGDNPRPLPKSRHLEMTRSYAAVHQELKDSEAPSPAYREAKFEQIEDGELKAESLK